MVFKNYKQKTSQGCLVVNLMYLFDIEPSPSEELAILSEGLTRLRENYTLSCLTAFLDRHPGKKVTLYIDNKYYLDKLKSMVDHPAIKLTYKKNDAKLLDSLAAPFVVYVDNNITDGWTHLPHFLLVVGASNKFYNVFDSWTGKVTKISKTKLISGIDLLRSHVKICPFVIRG